MSCRLPGLVLSLGFAGCDLAFGLDEVDELEPATLTLERCYLGASVSCEPLPSEGNEIEYLVGDRFDAVPAISSGGGIWSALVPGTPPVHLMLDEPTGLFDRIWQVPKRNLSGTLAVLDRPDPEPPPEGARIDVDIDLPSTIEVGEAFVVRAILPWVVFSIPRTVGTNKLTYVLDYASAVNAVKQPRRIRADDAVCALRYVNGRLTGSLVGSIDQQLSLERFTGAMTAVVPDRSVTLDVQPAVATSRFLAVQPAVPPPTLRWLLLAAPGHALPSASGIQLDSAVVAADGPTALALAYANPFDALDWKAMLLWYAISTRTYTPPGYQVAPLTTSLYHYADPAQAGQSLDMPAGLPLLISINGQELTEDGQLFAIDPDEPFSVTFLSDRSDNALYRMELHDILPDPSSTESNYGQIIGITSAVPSVVVPPGRLARGRYYMLRVGTTRGLYPGLAGGHLAAGGLPFATSSFEVVFGTER